MSDERSIPIKDVPLGPGKMPAGAWRTGTVTYTEHHWMCAECRQTSFGSTFDGETGAGHETKRAARKALNDHLKKHHAATRPEETTDGPR